MIHEPTIILCPERLVIDPTARVDGFVKLECAGGLVIGPRVHVASFCHVGIGGGAVILDDACGLASGVKIISGSAIPSALGCSPEVPGVRSERSFVRVSPRATVFAGAIILPGVTIGEGAVVGPGSVIHHDVPAWEFWTGTPARKVRSLR